MHVWFDGKRVRLDAYGSIDSTLMLPGITYNTFPRIDVPVCWAVNTTAGPTLLGSEEVVVLPDISGWAYGGETTGPRGVRARIWTLSDHQMEKTNSYTFLTASDDGRPLSLVRRRMRDMHENA
eukprot:95949-Chlamydomonas_euryale.AAC.1